MTTNWKQLQEDSVRNYVAPPAKPKHTGAKQLPTKGKSPNGVATWDDIATRFTLASKDEIRYSSERGMWLVWDKHVWRWDTTDAVRELVKEFGRDLAAYPVEDVRAAGMKILNTKGINEILNLARSDERLAVRLTDFDAGVYEINTPAGMVDLWTGELAPANPANLVKRSTSVAPDSSCPTTNYERLLAQAFAGEPELSDYFEIMMGVTMIKAQDEQVFMYMFGEAGSGKGTLMNIAQALLGTGEDGYATYVDSSVLVKSRSQAHPTELMQFLGARMAITSEISEGQKLDTAKLKKITGGDTITGRYMGKDFVSFDATHTLWLMANYRLQVPKDDKGVWRRLKTIEFKHSKKEQEFIKRLDKLIIENEGPGVMARWISKATLYLKEGFYIPQAVIDANESYKEAQDTVDQWIEGGVSFEDTGHFETFKVLREDYLNWCRRERRTPIGDRPFAQALRDKGFSETKKYIC
ncbi:phage/plasmid primase, P4 family [Arthrobacter sp. UYEF36]|uniref:DNA primase family protein n=1 Tax=Arthrobacter sp. UYEF36 TaxID=1756366 RepID=UPI003395A916